MPEVFEPGSLDLPAMGQQQTKHRDNGRLPTSLHEASLHTSSQLVSGEEVFVRKSRAQTNLGSLVLLMGRFLIPGKTVF
jgi:hypothetical protein